MLGEKSIKNLINGMVNGIIDKYNSLEFENIISLISSRVDRPGKVYQLKSINERKNVFDRIESYIKSENHLCLSLMRRDSPFSFVRLDEEGIVESVETFYEIYLMISNSKLYHYCVVKINVFSPNGGLSRELALLQEVKPFAFRFYFRRRRLIHNRD